MTDQSLGRQRPRAKPVILTFRDSHGESYAFTSTFYVREDATLEQIEQLIRAVCDLSLCILSEYKIGYEQFWIPDYRERLKQIRPEAFGVQKWRIKYYDSNHRARSHTIPGRNQETSLVVTKNIMRGPGMNPDLSHPKWQVFLEIFREICVTKEGNPIGEPIEGMFSSGKWPPKGRRRR